MHIPFFLSALFSPQPSILLVSADVVRLQIRILATKIKLISPVGRVMSTKSGFSLLLSVVVLCPACDSGTQMPVPTISVAKKTAGWSLVWQDEFNGSGIDKEKWSFQINCAGGGNNELQCYTDKTKNAFIKDGTLHIQALKESVSGFDGWDGISGNLVSRDYSSARMLTQYKADWRYARVEVNAKLPYGQGIWPAIWMMPSYDVYGNWPLSGELDLMEAVNLKTGGINDNLLVQTIHFGDRSPDNRFIANNYQPTFDVTAGFHTYAVEWQQGEIRWYVDQALVSTQTQQAWYTRGNIPPSFLTTEARPFDQEFHLLLNLAVGGIWPGPPDDSTRFPQTLLVDYVRVYECSANTLEGIGCETPDGAGPSYE